MSTPRIEPRAAGCEASMLPLCYSDPPTQVLMTSNRGHFGGEDVFWVRAMVGARAGHRCGLSR